MLKKDTMKCWSYRENRLFVEDVEVEKIVKETGTPVYIYSASGIRERVELIKQNLDGVALHLIAYAVKSNSNGEVLEIIKKTGCGAEVVSGGELFRIIRAGFHPSKVVFTGVGKTESEIEYAIREGILMIVIESKEEAEVVREIAEKKRKEVRIAVRVNPQIDPQTHPYIATSLKNSKFGVDENTAMDIYRSFKGDKYVKPIGIHMHLGSQIKKVDVYLEGAEKLLRIVKALKGEGISIEYLDIGGGFGISYEDDNEVFDLKELANGIKNYLKDNNLKLIIEPGRFIIGKNGILVGRIIYRKSSGDKNYYVTDIGMNDLIRPSLYGAIHRIIPVHLKESKSIKCDVVGPVCESGDFIGKDLILPELERGDLIAVLEAGAYGFVMASNYNSRGRPAEVIVNGRRFRVIRRRETYRDLIRGEVE